MRVNVAILGLVLGAVVFVYLPGLSGPFVFDDEPNLINNPYIHLESLDWPSLRNAALSGESGLFRRPIASLSFGLNFYLAGGFVAFYFKLTNLIIHGINAALVFLLAERVSSRFAGRSKAGPAYSPPRLLPLVVATVWLLHPIQLTSVLYIVQRMTSMSAFFVLAGLLIFFDGRTRFSKQRPGGLPMMAAGILAGAGIGALCKENALLLPFYAGVIELCCFSRKSLDAARRRQLRVFYWTVLGVPVLLACVYAALRPGFILGGYESRTFTLLERVLTQPRVLFYYLGLIVFPSPNELGLFHDDFPVSTGLLSPLTTAMALAGWLGVGILAVALRRRMPVLLLAVAWFLSGHGMESTVLALEMNHEHRNYLPSFGPIFAFSYAGLALAERLRFDKRLAYGLLGLVVLNLGLVTHSRASSWSATRILLESSIRHHPDSARSHLFYSAELIKIQGDIFKAFYHLQQSARLSPASIAGLGEMMRITDALALLEPVATRASPERNDTASIFEVTLTKHPSRLAHIKRLASDEITRRLKTQLITPETVQTLRGLQGCLYEGRETCVALASELARWHELALSNPRLIPRFRAILYLAAAKVQSWMGDTDRALVYAELAAATAPGEIYFLLNLAEFHLFLQDHNRGLAVVERIKRQGKPLDYRMDQMTDLEARLKSGASDTRAKNGSAERSND